MSTETAAPPGTESLLRDIGTNRICPCPPKHMNCLSAKQWLKRQIGVWRVDHEDRDINSLPEPDGDFEQSTLGSAIMQFSYEGRDIRDKTIHPATFPISLAKRVIELFTHRGELVLDPFVGSGTTLVAAQESERNAVGFDLQEDYISLAKKRVNQPPLHAPGAQTRQEAIPSDARDISRYLSEESVSLIFTSPPYANLLNRRRKNKSRRGDLRKNGQYMKVEQYSQDPRDLGTLSLDPYGKEMATIFKSLLPLLRPGAHCVVNVPDMWWNNSRVTIHVTVIEALESVGYELRNTIIWDRTNIVNGAGIFGWPSNYITMGTTFEYLLDFWRPPVR